MTDHHDEAEAYRNRAERAEQFAGELQAKIDALQQHAEAMAGLLGMPEVESKAWLDEQQRVLANWTAWLIDNPLAQGG